MPIAKIGDVSLNYTVEGSGDWLVLIGGYASGNWQAWGAQLAELSKTWRVLAFDNRGIGASDVPDYPYTTRMMALDALGLMDHLGIERAHVLGKSLGGAIAQWVAIEQPQRVRSLAMSSTFARPSKRFTKMVEWWVATAGSAGFSALFPGQLTYFYSAEYYEANFAAIEKATATLVGVNRPLKGFAHTGHAAVTHDTWDRLAEIRVPTLILCGEEDVITPPRHSLEFGARIPGAEVHIEPRTLHGLMTEKPETFRRVKEFFLRN